MEEQQRAGGTAVVPRRGASGNSALAAALGRQLRRPRTASLAGLWLVGLYVVFFARAPVKITPQMDKAFQQKIGEAEGVAAQLMVANNELMGLEIDLSHSQPWFWRWREGGRWRAEVAAKMPAVKAARARVKELRGQRDVLLRSARSQLGLWSEAGLEEGRELWWASFSSGKLFAQRQTFWDAFMMILTGHHREGEWLGMLLQLLLQTLLNFTTGLIASLFFFLCALPTFLWSFAPSLPAALAFAALALVGAASVVASYLAALYAAGAAAAYATISMAAAQRTRLQGPTPQQQRRLHYE